MLEIIALYFLCKHIGQIALRKGQVPGRWKLFTILAWIFGEFTGILLGAIFFGLDMNNLLGLALLGLISAVGGYLFVKAQLDKLPDSMDDEINRIGQ